MEGFSPKLPLRLDPSDGYLLNKNLKEVVTQNLKMLILTSPGERVMEPTFGVWLYNYLFELNTQGTKSDIRERILSQVKKYMPFLEIIQIDFGDVNPDEADLSALSVKIKYKILPLNVFGDLSIKID